MAEDICAICLEARDDTWQTTACNHGFHAACIAKVVAEHRSFATCPLCRADLRFAEDVERASCFAELPFGTGLDEEEEPLWHIYLSDSPIPTDDTQDPSETDTEQTTGGPSADGTYMPIAPYPMARYYRPFPTFAPSSTMSFGMAPAQMQPSGSVNFSRIDTVSLRIYPPHNFMRISNGMAGLTFAH